MGGRGGRFLKVTLVAVVGASVFYARKPWLELKEIPEMNRGVYLADGTS